MLSQRTMTGRRARIDYLEYRRPKWSPDGKLIAALASTGTTVWVAAATTRGQHICRFVDGARVRLEQRKRINTQLWKVYLRFELLQDQVAEPDAEPAAVGLKVVTVFEESAPKW
jgi:hypothetical protein